MSPPEVHAEYPPPACYSGYPCARYSEENRLRKKEMEVLLVADFLLMEKEQEEVMRWLSG